MWPQTQTTKTHNELPSDDQKYISSRTIDMVNEKEIAQSDRIQMDK